MSNATVPSPDPRNDRDANRRKPEEETWERRHIRSTFWLEQTLREEVRAAANARSMSITQFVAQALRRAVDEAR